jgi:hypothetical protein
MALTVLRMPRALTTLLILTSCALLLLRSLQPPSEIIIVIPNPPRHIFQLLLLLVAMPPAYGIDDSLRPMRYWVNDAHKSDAARALGDSIGLCFPRGECRVPSWSHVGSDSHPIISHLSIPNALINYIQVSHPASCDDGSGHARELPPPFRC